MKICSQCKEEHLETEFHKDKKTPDGLTCYCKTCAKAKVLQWRRNNSTKVQLNRRKHYTKNRDKVFRSHNRYRSTEQGKARNKVHQWRSYLKIKYNLTEEMYKTLLKTQDFRCKICDSRFTDSLKPKIDHCHKTGKVRGVLCNTCNTGLGHIEREGFLDKAIMYLRKV